MSGFPGHLPLERVPLRFRFVEGCPNFGRIFFEVVLLERLAFWRFDRFHLLADITRFLLPSGEPLAIAFGFILRNENYIILRRGIREKRLQTIVVALEDWLEFMIVTPRARVTHPCKNKPDRVRDVIQDFLATLPEIARIAFIGVVPVERGRDLRFGITGKKFVTSDLFLHEAVVGLVSIERTNDVITIAPGIWPRLIRLKAFAFGIARQIQPMPGPALPVIR